MARLVVEDAMFYLFILYGCLAVLYGMPLFSSYYPGMVYNQSSQSFVQSPVTAMNYTPFVFANNSHYAYLCSTYATVDTGSALGLLDPRVIVDIVLRYIGLFLAVMNPLTQSLLFVPLFGPVWGMLLSSVLNLAFVVVMFTMISGRLRRD